MGHRAYSCSIDGCNQLAWARGWCRKHYARWRAHGDPAVTMLAVSAPGAGMAFIHALPTGGDRCILWPFARNNHGYGQLNIGAGRKVLAHRLACELAHGPAPTSRHVAAHSCGGGHLGCVAPWHLSWKTQGENARDTIAHGRTTRGRSMAATPLTEEQVRTIFRRAHAGEAQSAIAVEYGISQTAVSRIKVGRNWGWLTGGLIGVTPERMKQEARAA